MPSRNNRQQNDRQQNNRQRKGHRRRDGRTVFRLDAAAFFERLNLLGRSQNWLAGQVGVSPAYVSLLVNGGRSPSGRIRRRMLKVLGVANSRHLFRTEDKHEPR